MALEAAGAAAAQVSQRAQYGLVKEDALNHIRDPHIIQGIFLNSAILGSLGSRGLGSDSKEMQISGKSRLTEGVYRA